MDNNSPFYSNYGYHVTHVFVTSAHLCNIAYIDRSTAQLGTFAPIAPTSEFAGIHLCVSINSIIHVDDTLFLYLVTTSPGSSPLVTTFAFHPSFTSHLRIFVTIAYENSRLHYLSEPAVINTEPHEETLLRMMPNEDNYRYRVAIVRQSHLREACFVINLQLTFLSPQVVISIE